MVILIMLVKSFIFVISASGAILDPTSRAVKSVTLRESILGVEEQKTKTLQVTLVTRGTVTFWFEVSDPSAVKFSPNHFTIPQGEHVQEVEIQVLKIGHIDGALNATSPLPRIMYVIRVHPAEEIDDAMVLLSVLAHVKLEVTSPHTIVLRLEGDNRLRKKTIEEKLGSLYSSVRWHADDADIEKCLKTEEVRAKYNVVWPWDGAFHVNVFHSYTVDLIADLVGWIYFFAWSISFYPQIYSNWRRKSVEGLNFDFVILNITGFIAYGLFNVGLYWVPSVMAEYHRLHPKGVNPVQLNDVVFSLHATFACIITGIQCCIYERGDQKVSVVAMVLMGMIGIVVAISLILTLLVSITWLTYLYIFSYVKLAITIIKYFPQAVFNYRRKSTQGWSIGNILCDFTGGVFSILQMFMIAANNDDWGSIFGDPTKFGLGLFSILFDFLFMFQHYYLYRDRNAYTQLSEETTAITRREGCDWE
ncbi:unnamed protein product [Darwinula stevensoni]|uniref:Cystinosin homolog n=2 Tax=Darwinula stevensoni TaxID=69355 RepID=A0A7R9A3F2_9CRUS|nr:unnamed protein product [Darwinula stevensoni]CAG0890575.1 unnamed protein product [Darwinula stevensoni]